VKGNTKATTDAAIDGPSPSTLGLTVEIVAAYLSNNSLGALDLPAVIRSVYVALTHAATPTTAPVVEKLSPAVSVKKSVTPDFLICLEDGKKLKTLKRHLATGFGLTPDEYRTKWDLPPDYPMVAPNYAAQRSAMARSIGLGRKPAPVIEAAPRKKAGRPKKTTA